MRLIIYSITKNYIAFFLISGLHTFPNETSNQVTQKGEKADRKPSVWSGRSKLPNWQMSHDWTNQSQRRYASDNIAIQNPLFHKSCLLKIRKCDKKQTIKISLTLRRRKTFTYGYSNYDSIPEIDFFYANMQSSLQFRLKNAINNNLSNKRQLIILVEKFGCDLDHLDAVSQDGSSNSNRRQD